MRSLAHTANPAQTSAAPGKQRAKRSNPAEHDLPEQGEDFASPAIPWHLGQISIRTPAIQTKLTVNQPGDAYEQEADRVADQIMNTPASAALTARAPRSIQRKCACGGTCSECSHEAKDDDHDQKLQRKTSEPHRQPTRSAPASVQEVLRTPGHPLDSETRKSFESRFGYSFANVRVHTNSQAAASAHAVHAHAYTVGTHVVFGAAQYSPSTPSGGRLLAHELTHVVQQSGGGRTNSALPSIAAKSTLAVQRDGEDFDDIDFPVDPEGGLQIEQGGTVTYTPPARSTTPGNAPAKPAQDPDSDGIPDDTTDNESNSGRTYEGARDPRDQPGTTPSGPPRVRAVDRGDQTNMGAAVDLQARVNEAWYYARTLETPKATLEAGGAAPSFITELPNAQAEYKGFTMPYTSRSFHILDAIEYGIAHARNTKEVLRIITTVLPGARVGHYRFTPFSEPSADEWPLMHGVELDESIDPNRSRRIAAVVDGMEALQRRLGKRRKPATDPRTDPNKKPEEKPYVDPRRKKKQDNPCSPHLDLPAAKEPHRALYERMTRASRLAAFPEVYERGNTKQVANWIAGMDPEKGGIMNKKLVDQGTELLSKGEKCGKNAKCNADQRERVLRPDWTPKGDVKQMDVDHIIELQVGFIESIARLDQFDNYELLDASTNSSVGKTLDNSIRAERKRLQSECPSGQVPWDYLPMVYELPVFKGGGQSPGDRWTKEQVAKGEHLKKYRKKSK